MLPFALTMSAVLPGQIKLNISEAFLEVLVYLEDKKTHQYRNQNNVLFFSRFIKGYIGENPE